jgi:hypothetical protein
MTKTAKKTKQLSWLKVGIAAYWIVVALFVLIALTGYGLDLAGVSAATNPNAVADTAGGVGFDVYVCNILLPAAGTLIGALTVLMIIAAGIVYATSQGAGSGDLSIGTAKQMIMAALTGALLYILGTFLLGKCDIGAAGGGGFIQNFIKGFRGVTTEQTQSDGTE